MGVIQFQLLDACPKCALNICHWIVNINFKIGCLEYV